MKTLLCLCCFVLSFGASGQGLPVDSLSGKIAYAGVVSAPGIEVAQLFERAKTLALGANAPAQLDESSRTVTGVWEKQIVSGAGSAKQARVLRYRLAVTALPGRYRYVLTDFENKTLPVSYINPATGITASAPGGTAPLERVLAHPDGYRRGTPTPALRAYQAAVKIAAEQAVADVQRYMQGAH